MHRDMKQNPYDEQEKRVADYLHEITEGQMGGGDDPIGFLIASHNTLRIINKSVRDAADDWRERARSADGQGSYSSHERSIFAECARKIERIFNWEDK